MKDLAVTALYFQIREVLSPFPTPLLDSEPIPTLGLMLKRRFS